MKNDLFLLFQQQYPSPEQKKSTVRSDADISSQQTEIILDDEETNDRPEMVLKDVPIQNQDTIITLDDKTMKNRQKEEEENDEIMGDPSHKFDGLNLTINEEGRIDQRQMVTAVGDANDSNGPIILKNARFTEAVSREENFETKTGITDTIETDPGPIVGYAEEPLLPLKEACAPLSDILRDLSVYVQFALDETPAEPLDGLTIDESAAIRLYTIEWVRPHRSLYSMLNYTLKTCDREDLRPYFKYLKLFLTALAKLPCVPQLTLWRGVTKNLSAEFQPGTRVTWWAFSSCTSEMTVLENNMYLGNAGSRTLFSVEAINGRTIREHSHFVTEDEILLLPGTHMVVQSQLSPAPDLYIIHLKQVIPEEVLLEPPFEGILNIFNY